MGKYLLSSKAVQDLEDIWVYTLDHWSESQADGYYGMLISSIGFIMENPMLFGKDYSFVKEGLRGYKAKSHIIFYLITSQDEIFVVRILHESRDFNRSNYFELK